MSDDRFFDRLREDARQLRFQPEDEVLWTRLTAKVRARAAAQPDVPALLARWFRPITASFLMLALAAALSVAWLERGRDAATPDIMASNSVEISVDGDTFSLTQ